MNIGIPEIRNRFEKSLRVEVSGVPNVADRLSGAEYLITHASVTWIWTSRGYTSREVSLSVRRILKSGAISQNPQRRSAPSILPEWLDRIVSDHTPFEWTSAANR